MKKLKTYTVCDINVKEIRKICDTSLKAAALQFIETLKKPAEWRCRIPECQRYAIIIHQSDKTILNNFVVF